MICEKCLICGMDLMWVPSDRPDKGDYYHLFSSGYNHENYKFIHRPVPCLEDPSLTDGSGVPRGVSCCIGEERLGLKVEPRASVAPESSCGDMRAKEKQDVRLVAHFLKAIFEAR